MMEPLLFIDLDSSIPVYRQIVNQIRHACVTGTLSPDQTLPSVRRLALDLGVHHNTVAEAYRTLAEEGWVEVSQGKPVRIIERTAARPQKELRVQLESAFDRRLRQFLAEVQAQGLSPLHIARRLREIAAEMEV